MLLLVVLAIILILIGIWWLVLWRFYQRSTTEIAFVRTGFLGRRVVQSGGAFVIPVLHEATKINLSTLRLEVTRAEAQSLITRDRLRADVTAAFYVRVRGDDEAVARAAQSLGNRTMSPDALAKLLEGKFVAALRAAAGEMSMDELYEQRAQFTARVKELLGDALSANGLELESVSVTRLDQTGREFFNPTNASDAQGLTRLTESIEARRKQRNEIEQDSQIAIQQKNLETERRMLEIQRDEEYARLQQEREVALVRAETQAEVARVKAARQREADEAEIEAKRQTDLARLGADRAVEEERIALQKALKELEIVRQKALELADIEKRKVIELAEQRREIDVAEQTRLRSIALASAEQSRADAVRAEESVITAREMERAERTKMIELVAQQAQSERFAIARVEEARAEVTAVEHRSQAIQQLAEAESQAEKIRVAAAELRAKADAAARRGLNEADNALGSEAIEMRLRLALVDKLEGIVRESARPLENIDGIKIVQIDGLTGGGRSGGGEGGGSENLADSVVNSALRYRAQGPLIDQLLREVGLSEGKLGDVGSLLHHRKDEKGGD